jgi:hypothetical protein
VWRLSAPRLKAVLNDLNGFRPAAQGSPAQIAAAHQCCIGLVGRVRLVDCAAKPSRKECNHVLEARDARRLATLSPTSPPPRTSRGRRLVGREAGTGAQRHGATNSMTRTPSAMLFLVPSSARIKRPLSAPATVASHAGASAVPAAPPSLKPNRIRASCERAGCAQDLPQSAARPEGRRGDGTGH